MLTIESRVETDQSSRYLVRLCTHAASMGRPHRRGPHLHLGGELSRREVDVQAEWSETHGTITLSPWGDAGSRRQRTYWCSASKPPTNRTCAEYKTSSLETSIG